MDTFTVLNPYFNQKSVNCAEISRKTNINERTIQRYYKKFLAQTPLSEIRKPGRPPKFSKDLNRKLGKIVKENNSLSTKSISKFLNETKKLNISARTVNRRLNQIGHSKMKPRFVPKLNKNQKNQRVLFGRKHRNQNWNSVIFSDESMFQLDHNSHMVWAKNRASANVPKSKYSKKVMIWGAFSAKGKSKLFFVDKTLNSEGYQRILKSHVLPYVRKYFKKSEYIFQQDNAPCHNSASTKAFMRQKGINTMEWPANSADLNPIENIWGIMKVKISQRNPKNVEELKQFIQEEWNNINPTTIKNLINSKKNRVKEVIEKKGEKINY